MRFLPPPAASPAPEVGESSHGVVETQDRELLDRLGRIPSVKDSGKGIVGHAVIIGSDDTAKVKKAIEKKEMLVSLE